MLKYLVFVGAFVSFCGILFYIKEIISGKVKPNKVSWLMWSIAPLIATIAALSEGVRFAVVPVFMSGFGPLIVFIFTFFSKQSYWKSTPFDYLCGFFSLLALVLWWVTKDPNVAILFAIISDGFAAIPTLLKIWSNPETEISAPYLGGIFSAFTGLVVVPIWVFSQFAFPMYLIIVNCLLIFAIYRKKIRLTNDL